MLDVVRRGLPVIVLGTILIATGGALLMAALATTTRRRFVLSFAGLFTALYGVRLAVKTPLFALVVADASWLPYLRSALATLLFALLAIVAIPFEIATHAPGRLNAVADPIVIPLMALILVNAAVAALR